MASVLQKCFDLIDAFDMHHRELSVTELSARLDLPHSTVHRFLAALMQRGFVRQDPVTKRYTLSMKFWEKGCLVVNWHGFTTRARAFMEELNGKIGETVTLGVMEDGYSVYVDELQSVHPIATQRYLGRRMPGHASATGKAILAHRPDELARVLEHGLTKFTPRTITSQTDLLRELSRIKARGYSVGRGEWLANMVGVAAPVWNHSGRVVGAISVSSPRDRMPPHRIREIGATVSAVADRLSKELGHVSNAGADRSVQGDGFADGRRTDTRR